MLSEKIEDRPDTQVENLPVLRVAICGEVSSGKSTVVNALMRAHVLPDNIGAKQRPVVFASYNAKPGITLYDADGRETELSSANNPDALRGVSQIRIWSNHTHMQGLEFIEVPLTKAEELSKTQLNLIRSCDAMIWTTIASQAWRLTEKTIVETLGTARPRQAILAVTRADKLRNDKDRNSLKQRMVREAGHFFDDCIFVNGARKSLSRSAESDAVWVETGGAALVETLASFVPSERTEALDARVQGAELIDIATERALKQSASSAVANKPDQRASLQTDAQAQDVSSEESAHDSEVPIDGEPLTQLSAIDADKIEKVAQGLSGLKVIGFRHASPEQPGQILFDEEGLGPETAAFCHDVFCSLRTVFEKDDALGSATGFSLSTMNRRILFQTVPEAGLVFLMVDAKRTNQGSAQNALTRLCDCIGA